MVMRTTRRAILAKLETGYGVDALPTGANDAILIRDMKTTPMAGKEVERRLLRPHYGNYQKIPAGQYSQIKIEVELAGSGVAGTQPGYDPLMRACGNAVVVTPSTSVAYNPITGGEESLTIYAHRDGVLHKFLGCFGSVSYSVDADGIPFLTFDMMGLRGGESDVALPTIDTSGFVAPVLVNTANTSLTLHGYAASFSTLSINMATEASRLPVAGASNRIGITDRKASGSVTLIEPPVGTIDFYDIAENATLDAMTLTHGLTAGNICTITAPSVGIGAPAEAEIEKRQALTLPLSFNPAVGNDELVLTLT